MFVDTGAFIARYCTRDQYNKKATKQWQRLSKQNHVLYTSSFVLSETFSLLGRKSSYEFAAQRAHVIYNSDVFTILRPDHRDELAALDLFSQYADQAVSFTDCISFVLMRRYNLKKVFGFDRHFTDAGFELVG